MQRAVSRDVEGCGDVGEGIAVSESLMAWTASRGDRVGSISGARLKRFVLYLPRGTGATERRFLPLSCAMNWLRGSRRGRFLIATGYCDCWTLIDD